MPLSHCQYVAIQKYQWWNCRQNTFAELTLIYDSEDVSLGTRNVLHTVRCFSGSSECLLPFSKLQIRSSWCTILSWTACAHSKLYHKPRGPAYSQRGLYQHQTGWWLHSQQWMMDLKFNRLVGGHVCRSINLFFSSSCYLNKFFGESVSGSVWFSPSFLLYSSLKKSEWIIEMLAFSRCHMIDFVLQSLFCTQPISIWPFGCHLLSSIQAHLTFPTFWCWNHFSRVHVNLHCSTDFMNLLCP